MWGDVGVCPTVPQEHPCLHCAAAAQQMEAVQGSSVQLLQPSPITVQGQQRLPMGELQAAAREEGAAGKLRAPPVALCEGTTRLSFRPSPPVLCTERAVRITKTYHDIDAVTNLLDEVSWCTGTWGCGTGTRGDNPG